MVQALSPEKCERIRRLCQTYDGVTVCRLAKISSYTLWALKKRGFKPVSMGVPRKPLPADFSVMANRMSYDELSRHYHVGGPTLREWFKQVDRQYKSPRVYDRLPVPPREEIVEVLARMEVQEAIKYFGVSDTTFRKWRRELGIPLGTNAKPSRVVVGISPRFVWDTSHISRRAA